MKNHSLSVRIAKPCHEDWAAMTPTDQGRFCGSCQKKVTDFSHMTDNEVLEIIGSKPTSMCGQFRGSQLNRAFIQSQLSGSNSRLNSFFAAFMLLTGAGALSAQTTVPPYNPKVIIDEKHPTGPVCIRVPNEKSNKRELTAIVVDTLSGNKLSYATITISGTNCSVIADEHGKFSLVIPDSLATETISLWIYSPGYMREEYSFSLSKIDQISKIEIGMFEMMMKGDMIIEEPPKRENR